MNIMYPLSDKLFRRLMSTEAGWNVTKEISRKGELYDRAVGKEMPMEFINTVRYLFQLNLN